MKNLYKREADEKVYWIVYEPSYINRWSDDATITKAESKQDDGRWLHSIRKKATEKVKTKGSMNYIHRIKTIAAQNSITYKGISQPQAFWDFLKTFPKHSINRVWYVGHANGDSLFLSLAHDPPDNNCIPIAASDSTIDISEIKKNSELANRFITNTKKSSKFYGCYTSIFAQEWHQIFGVPAEGPINKIDFSVIDRPSHIKNVLERIERTTSNAQRRPEWQVYQ